MSQEDRLPKKLLLHVREGGGSREQGRREQGRREERRKGERRRGVSCLRDGARTPCVSGPEDLAVKDESLFLSIQEAVERVVVAEVCGRPKMCEDLRRGQVR